MVSHNGVVFVCKYMHWCTLNFYPQLQACTSHNSFCCEFHDENLHPLLSLMHTAQYWILGTWQWQWLWNRFKFIWFHFPCYLFLSNSKMRPNVQSGVLKKCNPPPPTHTIHGWTIEISLIIWNSLSTTIKLWFTIYFQDLLDTYSVKAIAIVEIAEVLIPICCVYNQY